MAVNFDAIKFVESNVNLDSYSSADGFLGYCNSKVGWGNEKCIKAFLDMIASLIPDEILVSSLRVYGDLKEHSDLYELSSDDESVRNRLIEAKVIINVSADEEAEFFHYQGKVISKLLHDFVLYQSSIGELSYHGFITNSAQEFIIYPHDDCGLGFIYCGSSEKDLALEQLIALSKKYLDILDFKLIESSCSRPL